MHSDAILNKDMSWYNPSQEEAIEYYTYYQKEYSKAANQYYVLIRQEQAFSSQKNAAVTQKNNLSVQKLNFEKRLEGVIAIIRMLEGTGGGNSKSVPSMISKATSTIQETDVSYKKSIKMMSGVSAASLQTAFTVKTVEGNENSGTALQAYKSEKKRLEQEINDLKNKINALENEINVLSRNINTCSAAQVTYKNKMDSSAYGMNHYRKYMY